MLAAQAAPDPNTAVARLCAEIDAAFDAADACAALPFGTRVRAALQRAAADPHGRYAIAALVWEPGQASPVHGHRTWCGYAVIEGTLAETLFRWDADAHDAVEVRRHPRAAGAVSYVDARRGAIHRFGNPADASSRAISLRVYSVAGSQIATHINDLLAA